jgi:hypothetical protein
MLRAAKEEIEGIEEEWVEVLGKTGLTRLRRALLAVADALGPEEFL